MDLFDTLDIVTEVNNLLHLTHLQFLVELQLLAHFSVKTTQYA